MAIVSLSARTIRSKSFADGLLPQYQAALLAPNISSIQYLAIAGGGAGGVCRAAQWHLCGVCPRQAPAVAGATVD